MEPYFLEYLNMGKVRDYGCTSVREFIRRKMFDNLSKKFSDYDLASKTSVTEEKIKQYRTGEILLDERMIILLYWVCCDSNFVDLPIERLVPVKELSLEAIEEWKKLSVKNGISLRKGATVDDMLAEINGSGQKNKQYSPKDIEKAAEGFIPCFIACATLVYLDRYTNFDILVSDSGKPMLVQTNIAQKVQ